MAGSVAAGEVAGFASDERDGVLEALAGQKCSCRSPNRERVERLDDETIGIAALRLEEVMHTIEQQQHCGDRDAIDALGIADGQTCGDSAHVADLFIEDHEVRCHLINGLKNIDAGTNTEHRGLTIGEGSINLIEDPVGVGGKKDFRHGAEAIGSALNRPTIVRGLMVARLITRGTRP